MSCIQNRSLEIKYQTKILLRYFQERNKRKIKLRNKHFLCGFGANLRKGDYKGKI